MTPFELPSAQELAEAAQEHNVAFLDHAMAVFLAELTRVNEEMPALIQAHSKAKSDLDIAKGAMSHIRSQISSIKSLKWGMRG